MKTPNIAAIVKIYPPRLASNIYLRKRLFKALDEARSRPVIWIAAPGGAGKTTLVASYLKERRLPCLWYQIDQGDSDIASFFHYMGIAAKKAAPRYKKPLPHLTPEYLAGLPAFTRNYFRELYNRVSKSQSIKESKRSDTLTHGHSDTNRRFAIVFDNYQEVAEDSQLHEIMLNGLAEAPEGINIIIIGRLPLPPAMARLQVSETLSLFNWDDISLTLEESMGIGRLRTKGKGISKEVLEFLHKQTQGWVAGLILLLEQSECNITPEMLKDQLNHQTVFNYFAGEIFQRADKETQEFLLKTAFLPKATAPMARQLTGMGAEDIFSGLIKKNYFTIKHFLPEPAYEYHPLFRAFLEDKANKIFKSEELVQLKKNTANLLAEKNEIEAAVSLLKQINDWGLLIPLILKHARGLIEQGRSQTLEGWLRAIPDALREEQPWLLYWLGVCRMPFNLPEGRGHFEQAFEKFKLQNDAAGIFLAWAGVVETYIYQWGDFKPLDKWIAEIEELLKKYQRLPSPEIQAKVTAGVFTALMYRQPQHPALPIWTERLHRLIEVSPDASSSMIMGNHLLLYYTWWSGDLAKGTNLVNMLEPLSRIPDLAPLSRIAWHAIKAAHCWMTADNTGCIQAVEEGLKIAEATGVHVWDFMLLAQGVWGVLTSGEIDRAPSMFKRMLLVMDNSRLLDVCHYRYQAFTEAMRRNDVSQMKEHAEAALRLAKEAGVIWAEGIVLPAVARAYIASGKQDEVAELNKQAMQIAQDIRGKVIESNALHAEAEFAMEQGNESACLQALQKAFTIDRQQGFVNTSWARSSVMSRLCARALEYNIEAEYVQNLIRRRKLNPPIEEIEIKNWPWPVRIYTLGRFNVVRDRKSLSLSAPSSRKPLELLSALIAFGGRGISKEMLIEALWPDAEGDVAQQNFETTLHRLRKLLGSDEALVLKDGRLTLDDRCCWVDCWAFERLLTQLEHLLGTADAKPDEVADEIAGKIDSMAKKIFELYHGHFLGRESDYSWSLTLRERLRSRFLRHIKDMGRYWKGHEKIDEAVKYYIKGLEIDPISEGLYYGLMQCYIELGDFAEALSIYKRCCHALKTLLNTTPSPKIDAIYHSIRHDKTSKQEDRTSQ